jgi:hypothetical protein
MNKRRIFLGSSAQQAELLDAIAPGLEDLADVEPWMTSFNPGRSTLDRLVELSQEVGERPRHPNAPQLEATGEIKVESADRATGYWTTRSERHPGLNARTAGVYVRADPSALEVLDGGNEEERAELIAQRLREWKSPRTHSEHRPRSGGQLSLGGELVQHGRPRAHLRRP